MNALRGHPFRKLDITWRQHCAAEAARLMAFPVAAIAVTTFHFIAGIW
jgi:hypothetical protein